jgi:superfamily I DNA and/or RNA helicase
MLRVSNIITHPCSEPGTQWHDFHTMYNRHSKGDLDPEDMISFRALTKGLREHVLGKAQVVVCTVNNAGDSKLHEHFHSVVTFVDEAAKMTESDAIIPLAWNAKGPVLFVGDHMQLKPTVLSQKTSHFRGQLEKSLFSGTLLRSGSGCGSGEPG